MEKKILFVIGALVVLVIGALIVNANLKSEKISEEKPKEIVCSTSGVVSSENSCNSCDSNNCPRQCGGTCGIRSCGCS